MDATVIDFWFCFESNPNCQHIQSKVFGLQFPERTPKIANRNKPSPLTVVFNDFVFKFVAEDVFGQETIPFKVVGLENKLKLICNFQSVMACPVCNFIHFQFGTKTLDLRTSSSLVNFLLMETEC